MSTRTTTTPRQRPARRTPPAPAPDPAPPVELVPAPEPTPEPDPEPELGPAAPVDRTPAVRAALHAIPELLAAATSLADGSLVRGRFTSDRVRATSHDAPPSPSPAFDEADQVRAWAAEWVDTVAAVLDCPSRRRTSWPHPALAPALEWIDAVLDDALASPIGRDLARDVEATELRLTLLAGLEEHRARMVTPCPRCDRLSLVQADGSGTVECTAEDCRHVWTREQYDALLAAPEVRAAAAERTAS